MEPLYCGHLGDLVKYPVYSGTPLLWTPWGPGEVSCIERCPHFRGINLLQESVFGTQISVLSTEMSLFQGRPLKGVPLYSDILLRYSLPCASLLLPETTTFYKALSQVGTDFTMMTLLLPKRSRNELKVQQIWGSVQMMNISVTLSRVAIGKLV